MTSSEAADAIARFLATVDEHTFSADDLVRSAVLQKLMVIGEAISKLPDTLKSAHRDIRWADIVGFRNIAAHAYFAVNWSIVLVIASEQVPLVRRQVTSILESEYGAE